MFLVKLLSRIPLTALYLFSDFLFFIAYYIVRYRRKLVQKNLKASFPDKSVNELRNIEREFYRNLCDYAVETLKLLTITKEELGKRMVFTTPEIPSKYKNQNQSILILASHQFNWEWLVAAACFNLPMQVDFVYQKVNSNFFDRISMLCRTRFGAYAIKRDEVARETVKRRNIVRAVATMADQYPGYAHDKKFSTTFLNQETVFFYGVNQLALLTQYPVVFYEIHKIKRGHYKASAVEMAQPPYGKESNVVIERYVDAVENVIKGNPSGWLWSHNRWKKRHLRKPAGN
jgi:Kdo2-lipid IVA lauroyltransferase/acyltransferase